MQACIDIENQIEIELRDISAQIMLANYELSNHTGEEEPIEGGRDEFYTNMGEFCQEAARDAELLEEEFNAMAETTLMTAAYVGEPNATMDKVFEMLANFVASYVKAQAEHTRLIKSENVALGPAA